MYVLVILSTSSLAACNDHNPVNLSSSNELSQESIKVSPTPSVSQKKDEVFYGEWVIKKLLASDSITTHGDEDIQFLLGKKITYSADSVILYNETTLKNPHYKLSLNTKEEFSKENDNEISLEQLGIEGNSVTSVMIYEDEASKVPWIISGKNKIGWSFMIKDKDTLIIGNGGDFFELVRNSKSS
ncbi:hypothetical protein GK047_01520 [Paenibacillus sp. SYP-B3998]|uniref:Lipocalin-like domain-containing protein n=1 Tax=Paenibacillus sp. SYP-B3998 TaxID=2678564 RepID=A0A6G3ZRN5_9BACL|nr:hypothetical protein [Paenibacillus sp. SYP-B3998]NEW04698.1 hypothetical protein [Paenibacillus sp. SYP-B3998]